MTHETVAVVTTVLNEREGIRALLDGFLAQTRLPDEIVVVDGGSRDGSVELLRDYEARHPRLRVFVEPGVNIARGRNLAILRARSSIVAVTDGGCRPEPDWLAELVQPLLDDAGYGAVTGVRRIAAANRFEAVAGLLSTSGNAEREQERVFHGRNSAFRRSVWEAVGGYPEWLYTAEDTLFAQRAKALGCRVALASRAVVWWRPRPDLRRLARQYFLYGRGTGRIGMADMRAVRYHLRNHALWMAMLAASSWQPWLLLGAAGMLAFLHRTLLRPATAGVATLCTGRRERLLAAGIVMVRSLANNLGQLRGHLEFRRAPGFALNLQQYRGGQWRMADAGEAGAAPQSGPAPAAERNDVLATGS